MRLKHIDQHDSLNLWRDGLYERRETRHVMKKLKPGDVFVDVGAHIGYYTAIASDCVGEEGQVYAFEPAPENAAVLRLNLADMKHPNVRFFEVAVADYNGNSRLYLSRKSAGDHWLYEAEDREHCEVQVVSLDSIIKTEVDFMKVDVQGSESAVLKGAKDLIRRSPNIQMLIEHSAVHLDKAGSSGREMIKILQDYGFSIYVVLKTGSPNRYVVPLSTQSIRKYRERLHINLYCRKEGRPV